MMTYTNDLPSSLLKLETEQRLSQLGCAVTAGKSTVSFAGRMPRREKESKSARSSGGQMFATALSKAQSKD